VEQTIDTLFVVGVLINVVKGADLLLRPHQQKWLQRKVDAATLFLDYTKPLEWYKTHSIQRRVFKVAVVLLFVAGIPAILLSGPDISWWMKIFFVVAAVVGIYGLITSDLSLFDATIQRIELDVRFGLTVSQDDRRKYRSARIGKRLSDWLFASETFLQHFSRPLVLGLAFVGLLAGIVGSLLLGVYVFDKAAAVLKGYSGVKLFVCVIVVAIILSLLFSVGRELTTIGEPLFILGIPSIIITVVFVAITFAEFVLKLLRGVAYRIADYNKGAFAALVLIATIALGVLEAYLKQKTH
jgi:hypothetical protein